MRAEKALTESQQRLIAADTLHGLVTIYQEGEPSASIKRFHVRLVPRDTDGQLNAAGTVAVGSYNDLEPAVTAATFSYDVKEADWMPTSPELLALHIFTQHGPIVEGRRICPHDRANRDHNRWVGGAPRL